MREETRTTDKDQQTDSPMHDRPDVELSVDVLEERIAPGIQLNRCETLLVSEPDDVELSIDVLEERIAPGIQLNRCETIVAIHA